MYSTKRHFGKFLLLWSGNLISTIGSGLTTFGLGVYIFEQTGQASYMALITLLGFLPSILLSVPAGVMADRYDRRLLMVIGDGFSAIGLMFMLLCMMRGQAQIWQICVGISISSVFTALLEPAYRATISDLLMPEQYSKASSLVQLANNARFLVSPILTGVLLKFYDTRLLLVIDICTLVVTIMATLTVRRGLQVKKTEKAASFLSEFKNAVAVIEHKKGVVVLVVMGALISFCFGVIQILASPMILSFTDSTTLGTLTTIIALGMLVSSLLLSGFSIKKGYVRILCASLLGAGVFMVGVGLQQNIWLIGITGFLFFAMLPFSNVSLDFLIRTNIDNDLQGRIWGLVGFITQMGFAMAYAVSGLLADYVFTPLLLPGGALAGTVGRVFGVGNGRGIGFFIALAGIILCVLAASLYGMKSIHALEMVGAYER